MNKAAVTGIILVSNLLVTGILWFIDVYLFGKILVVTKNYF